MREKGTDWLKLYRAIQNNFLWSVKPFSFGQAWVDLLILATYEDKTALYQGKMTEFKRGTIYRSILSLADRWGWDRKKVRKFLDLLESENMVTTDSTTHGTTITIVNYAFYQDVRTTNETTDGATNGQPFPTYKKVKKEKNINTLTSKSINKPPSVKHQYGAYKNVLLSEEDLEKLKKEFPSDWSQRIENLSEGIAVHGYKYKNHLAVIRKWAKKDSREDPAKDDTSKQLREEWAKADEFFTGFE